MYKVQRKQTIEDELLIENSKGEEALRLHVKLYVDDILADYNRLRRLLGECQHIAEQDPTSEEAQTSLGMVIVALFELIFGKEGSEKILSYYENRYTEMLDDIAPFIAESINPQVNSAMADRAKRFKRLAK